MLHSVVILQIRLQRAELKTRPANDHFLQQIEEKKNSCRSCQVYFYVEYEQLHKSEGPGITDINNPYKSFYFVI